MEISVSTGHRERGGHGTDRRVPVIAVMGRDNGSRMET
jgi:hypothetical protein